MLVLLPSSDSVGVSQLLLLSSVMSLSSLLFLCFLLFYFLLVWMMSRSILRCVDRISFSCSSVNVHVLAPYNIEGVMTASNKRNLLRSKQDLDVLILSLLFISSVSIFRTLLFFPDVSLFSLEVEFFNFDVVELRLSLFVCFSVGENSVFLGWTFSHISSVLL